ncbi:MAG: DUF309 domain-containing protein, partial [Hyphomicrobiaceae bacterium]
WLAPLKTGFKAGSVGGETRRIDGSASLEEWPKAVPYLSGLALYRRGFYWEAHEVWEPVWRAAPPNSRERYLLAGLIQLANGCLKVRMARISAAGRLFAAARQLVSEAGLAGSGVTDRVLGLSPGGIVAAIEGLEHAIAGLGRPACVNLVALQPDLLAWSADVPTVAGIQAYLDRFIGGQS